MPDRVVPVRGGALGAWPPTWIELGYVATQWHNMFRCDEEENKAINDIAVVYRAVASALMRNQLSAQPVLKRFGYLGKIRALRRLRRVRCLAWAHCH